VDSEDGKLFHALQVTDSDARQVVSAEHVVITGTAAAQVKHPSRFRSGSKSNPAANLVSRFSTLEN